MMVNLKKCTVLHVFEGDNQSTKQMNHREGHIFWDYWYILSIKLEDKVVQMPNAHHPSNLIIVLGHFFFFVISIIWEAGLPKFSYLQRVYGHY